MKQIRVPRLQKFTRLPLGRLKDQYIIDAW